MGLVIDASRNGVATVIVRRASRSAWPNAPWYTVCPSRATSTTAPTTRCCATASASVRSIRWAIAWSGAGLATAGAGAPCAIAPHVIEPTAAPSRLRR